MLWVLRIFYARGIDLYMSKNIIKPTDIFEARKRRGWSQQVLADSVGVDQGTVSKWETGSLTPKGPAAKLLALVILDEVGA